MTGRSVGRAKQTVETGRTLRDAPDLTGALREGAISFDQAAEIAKAEEVRPGSTEELLPVARDEAFHVLRDSARRVRLEAEQNDDLGARQKEARRAHTYSDDLGMTNIHLCLEPHVGTPIVNRAEAARLHRKAKADGRREPFERSLADAYATLQTSGGGSPSRRPELVVLVSHTVAARGWSDVRDGEVCKIPGVGPVAPAIAKQIADDAFLSGVFFDGVDLRQMRRWTRSVPIEVQIALELGPPPKFDGIRCADCGTGFEPNATTSTRTSPAVPRRPTTSSRGAGPATRQRPSATDERANSRQCRPRGVRPDVSAVHARGTVNSLLTLRRRPRPPGLWKG